MTRRLDHVGHVVNNLDEGVKLYEKMLGLTPGSTGITEFQEFGARMAFLPLFDDVNVEVIQPGGLKGDPAARCLKERGEGLFHLSVPVDDYDAEVKAWREKGFTVEEYSHSAGDRTARLAFLSPEETLGLWIEFIAAGSSSD